MAQPDSFSTPGATPIHPDNRALHPAHSLISRQLLRQILGDI
jgi:hypothetical protein